MTDEVETASVPSGDAVETPLMIDRFVIEDVLGVGGMGRVYVAHDPTLDRRVALKVLRDHLGLDAVTAHARMAREARAMARLRHPNVVAVYEVGESERGVFIVMEYVEGRTLRDWLERDPQPSWREIVATYVLAGRGLLAAHEAELVHRDFKPDNVLVGDDGRVLVVDFGIADCYGLDSEAEELGDLVSERLTGAGDILGTPPYMSPEQHVGGAVDARSDQFAFSASLYEALYGVRPFAGRAKTEIAEHARRGELVPPIRNRGVPARIHAAVLRGLRSNPDDRFRSLAPLLDELAERHPSRTLAIGAAAAVVVGSLLWLGLRPYAATRPAPPIGPIAIEPFATTLAYGDQVDWREGIGDVVALLLGDVEGLKTVGPSNLLAGEHPDIHTAETKLAASYIVRGSIDQRGDRLYARADLVNSSGTTTVVQVDRPAGELAQLVDDLTNAVAEHITPGHHLERAHAAIRAHALYVIGDGHLRNTRFQLAWPFLEQAVIADPTFFESWYALALTRSWILAPESQVFDATAHARATAPRDVERALVDGMSQYLHHDLAGARTTLEAVTANPTLSNTELRDALYLLGEAHWHDGHYRIGVGYFRHALDLDVTYKLPVQHLGEYAMANRDLEALQQYSLMISSPVNNYRDYGELVRGNYEQLARDGRAPTQLYATLILGRTPSPEVEAQLGKEIVAVHIYRAARALDAGDAATAHAEIDEVWTQVEARRTAGEIPDSVYFLLRLLGDVIVTGGMIDEARRLVRFLAAESQQHPVRNYQRMSILTAALAGDPTLLVRRDLTDRDRRLADAIEAELHGDRARAVELLDSIVHDPSPYWDYPERVALLRNLRALHRTEEARALCEDTLHPAVFQFAFLSTRRACAVTP